MVVHGQPKWRDQLLIKTCGKGIQRLFALRDFRVSAPSGERPVSATSSWVILDRVTGRAQRIDPQAAALQVLTPPCGDAITVDYTPESACLKWTFTTPIEGTYGRTGSRFEETARAQPA